MPSLFRRVGKYLPSTLLDPSENRLTESFASVLERVGSLPGFLVADWCDVPVPPERALVRTQRLTASGKFIDLELRFAGEKPLLVWVEVKHGADLHGGQIENYAADIATESLGEQRLILLAPRESMPFAPTGTTPVEWQRVGRQLRQLERGGTLDDIERFLVREFRRYLKEEGLADEEALNPATAFVFAARPSAERTLARLLEIADGYVRNAWGEPTDFSKRGGGSQQPNYGSSWWATLRKTPPGEPEPEPSPWGKAGFEWGFRQDAPSAESRDAFAFFAGTSFFEARNNPLTKPGYEAWISNHAESGFERVSDNYWRLWRYLYPEQLMARTTLEAQARLLADWVEHSFRLLAETPPPD
jgi:hypothetical protein